MAAEDGLDAAQAVVARRRGRPGPQPRDGSRPVFGMPGRRFTPGKGIT